MSSPFCVFRLILQPWQQSQYHSRKTWNEVLPESQVIPFINIQHHRPHGHGPVTEEGEETTAVDEEVGRQTFGADTVEDGFVDVQCLEVDSTWEVGVEALGEAFADSDVGGDDWILLVG